jgi:hypothetical protein
MKANLELNKKNVDMFWKTQDPRLYKIISVMEGVEPWVLDDVESVARKIVLMGAKLAVLKTNNLSELNQQMTTIMAYICSGRALRIINWIDSKYPGVTFHYVVEARDATDWSAGKLLLDRLTTIKSLNLMFKILTPMRARLIGGILGDIDD